MQINSISGFSGVKSIYSINDTSKSASFGKFTTPSKPDEMALNEFQQKYSEIFLDSLNKDKEELYNFLDYAKFKDGSYLLHRIAEMFDMEHIKNESMTFLHKTPAENVESIKKNGFDPKKIRTTEYGPGFYFGGSESELLIYGGEKLKIDYEGSTAKGYDLNQYNTLNSSITNVLREHLNLKPDFSSPTVFQEQEALSKFVHEYSRHVITDKLGIDGAYAMNNTGYFVVFNPASIKNIEKA